MTRVKFDNGVEVDLRRNNNEQAGILVIAMVGDGLTALDPNGGDLAVDRARHRAGRRRAARLWARLNVLPRARGWD